MNYQAKYLRQRSF